MLTLAIDTSTNVLSIALVSGDEVLASQDVSTKNNQSEILMMKIEEMMRKCNLLPTDLEKIAVAIGPGSYTGIRVGVTAAKSLAYALDIPVVSVSSLKVMAQLKRGADIRVAMIDARRGTVFAAAYDPDDLPLIPEGHYDMEKFLARLPKEKTTSFITDHVLASKEDWVISEGELNRSKAEVLAKLSHGSLPVENVHNLMPNYLRKTEAELNLDG